MAAKLLHSLTEDSQDLQKQIGCMTGILQIFDRQSMVPARRLIGHPPKRLTSDGSHIGGGTSEKDYVNMYQRSTATESHTNKALQDKQRASTESSRPSFSSSSRSSSFSSLDYNKLSQPDPVTFDRVSFSETPSRDPASAQPNASPQFGRLSLDIRDVVKDSMNREPQRFSAGPMMGEEVTDSMLKPGDSPRPSQNLKTFDGAYDSGANGKQNLPADLKDSLRVLAKLREAPWYSNEHRELTRSLSYHSKESSTLSISKDAPRFSYDGRETNHLPFESRDSSKSNQKLKELPRLSLDSRVNPARSLTSEPKSNFSSKVLPKDSGNANAKLPTILQTSGTPARPPSVVAKLMGLETLPDTASSTDSKMDLNRSSRVEETVPFPKTSEVSEPFRSIRTSNSSKNLWKEPISPRWRSPDMAMKPISRFPIEPAPWKQPDRTRVSEKPVSRTAKVPVKAASPFPSVYSEIEKRLKDLEFTQSGKDLRALKQILEAMQAKGLLETEKEEQGSNFTGPREHQLKFLNPVQSAKLVNQRMRQSDQSTAPMKRGANSLKNFESPIVIMKPAKLVEKSDMPSSSMIPLDGLPSFSKLQGGDSVYGRKGNAASRPAKEHHPRTNYGSTSANPNEARRTSKSAQTVSRPQLPAKENTSGSIKSSGSISPRLQQNKLELEKRSRPPTPPSESNRLRRQPNKQQAEASSPGGRRRPRVSNIQQNDGHASEISVESRNLSCCGDESSGQSYGSVITESKVDSEVTSFKHSHEVKNNQYSSMDVPSYLKCDLVEKKSKLVLYEDDMLAEPAPEYPSPVSVLDNGAYTDESPSPVKHAPKAMKDENSRIADGFSNQPQCERANNLATDSTNSGVSSEINRKKLQNIENLVQKLRRLNSSHDEARTDYIASLCENTNPDHRYVSEILLASGLLLRDLGSSLTSFQFHQSGHPINPELFLVLEQTKASTLIKEDFCNEKTRQSKPKEKIHRKLIFDIVNEILAGKLVLVGPSYEPWLRPPKLAKSTLNAQRLLRDLCSEIEQLQAKPSKCNSEDEEDEWKNILLDDVMSRSESWTVFTGELSCVVLDVERMIFKDLVDEIVRGDGAGLKAKPTRRRQLFAK